MPLLVVMITPLAAAALTTIYVIHVTRIAGEI
jgi:hypothetical protein